MVPPITCQVISKGQGLQSMWPIFLGKKPCICNYLKNYLGRLLLEESDDLSPSNLSTVNPLNPPRTPHPPAKTDRVFSEFQRLKACKGKNVMVCDSCTHENLYNTTLDIHILEEGLDVWCVESGTFRRQVLLCYIICHTDSLRISPQVWNLMYSRSVAINIATLAMLHSNDTSIWKKHWFPS